MLGKDDIKDFYDRFGKKQDSQAFYEDPAVEVLIHNAAFDSAEGVVEFGCGTGRFAARLLSEHLSESAHYWGCDISGTMVELARSRTRSFATRAEIVRTEGELTLPLPDSSRDRFVCNYVLDLLAEGEADAIIAEARRILKPGGLVCLVSITDGIGPLSRVVMTLWKGIYALSPRIVGGCRPVQLFHHLEPAGWEIVHQSKVAAFGVASEVAVGRRLH